MMTAQELEEYCKTGPLEGIEQHHLIEDEMNPVFQLAILASARTARDPKTLKKTKD